MCKFLFHVLLGSATASILLFISAVLYAYHLDTNFEFDSTPWKSLDFKIPSEKNKLKVAFITLGTRGDYQPISLVANEFKQNGHDVIITARERYKHVMTDVMEFTENELLWIPDEEGKVTEEILGNTQRVADFLTQAFNFYEFFNRECERYLDIMLSDRRFDDIDLIVAIEYVFPTGFLLSQKRNAPLVILKYSPLLTVTNEYNFFSPDSKNSNPSIFNWINFQIYNFLSVYCQYSFFESFQKLHNLPFVPLHQLYYGKLRYEFPSYFMFSNQLYPEIKRLPKWWKYMGPVFNKEKKLSKETEAFFEMCVNDKIVYVGFGSFSLAEYYGSDTEHISSVFYNTLSKLDYCAIFLNATFKARQGSKETLNPKFLFENHLPHTLIFPKVDLIFHHGGAGTSQISAASGTMAIAIPILDEQRIHSTFTAAYGTALFLDNSNITEEILERTIFEALQVKDIKEKSQRIKDSSLGTKAVYDDILFWLK